MWESLMIKPQVVWRRREDVMANMIFMSLCIAAEGFLLFCLFHFVQELRQEPRRGSDNDLWIAPAKPNVVPLQFVGPASIAVWSEGTWKCFVRGSGDIASGDMKVKGAAKEHYDAAA